MLYLQVCWTPAAITRAAVTWNKSDLKVGRRPTVPCQTEACGRGKALHHTCKCNLGLAPQPGHVRRKTAIWAECSKSILFHPSVSLEDWTDRKDSTTFKRLAERCWNQDASAHDIRAQQCDLTLWSGLLFQGMLKGLIYLRLRKTNYTWSKRLTCNKLKTLAGRDLLWVSILYFGVKREAGKYTVFKILVPPHILETPSPQN